MGPVMSLMPVPTSRFPLVAPVPPLTGCVTGCTGVRVPVGVNVLPGLVAPAVPAAPVGAVVAGVMVPVVVAGTALIGAGAGVIVPVVVAGTAVTVVVPVGVPGGGAAVGEAGAPDATPGGGAGAALDATM